MHNCQVDKKLLKTFYYLQLSVRKYVTRHKHQDFKNLTEWKRFLILWSAWIYAIVVIRIEGLVFSQTKHLAENDQLNRRGSRAGSHLEAEIHAHCDLFNKSWLLILNCVIFFYHFRLTRQRTSRWRNEDASWFHWSTTPRSLALLLASFAVPTSPPWMPMASLTLTSKRQYANALKQKLSIKYYVVWN